jgi:hypothetical protein
VIKIKGSLVEICGKRKDCSKAKKVIKKLVEAKV